MTKAYRDGMDYIKAEEDYRQKEKYLDSITPSRRRINVSIGTNNSTTRMPIPDDNGNVYHYSAETTAMTGLRFQAPPGGTEGVELPSNINSKSGNPIIATKETEIRVDPLSGLARMYGSTGNTTPLENVIHTKADLPMPGMFPSSFPSLPNDSPFPLSPPPDIKYNETQYVPEVVANNRSERNNNDLQQILEDNIINDRFISIPAKTPIRRQRDRGIRRTSIIEKPTRTPKNKQVVLENQLRSEVVPTNPQFYPSEPGVIRNASSNSNRFQPYEGFKPVVKQRPKVEIPPQLPPPVNRRRQRNDEGDAT
ncbi:hypothetical protein DFS34DRAFT_667947 [Phlyctochytrium arcticum]|nr:hypothetical protein DFS34DRAFT_667947 [Phlyctochytrium arcticum]